ncbi:fucose-1-phosphate guanylyltransferase-like [Babylonia areolata]|uniref:fucose-1-phosphate guanylyltransferase-like n=1 Tax=Babylonia areolata TaxID=304850 RepID=UPI003FD4F7C2
MASAVTQNMRRLLEQYQQLRGRNSPDGAAMWNVVVITTADAAQQEAFQQQIQDKHKRKELPLDLPIHIVSDPPGPRIGNGGSTLTALEFLHSVYGDSVYGLKVLLIHAGGWSQRMPSATILGKVFAAIPHGEPLYQMLDLKLAMYLPLIPHLPPGVFLVCADDFLVYDLGQDDNWAIPSTGVTALAHPSTMEVGRSHGVYVVKDADSIDTSKTVVLAQCLEVLQKPTDDLMRSKGALLKSDSGSLEFADGICMEGDVVYTDSCFFFGVDVMKKFLNLKKEIGTVSCEIDAYGDFLQALGPKATDEYIYNTSNISQVTSDLRQVRKQVFAAMCGTDIHVLLLNASQFIHVGTTKELIHYFSQDQTFQSQMFLQKDVFNCWLSEGPDEMTQRGDSTDSKADHSALSAAPDTGESQGCVMHSVLMRSSSFAATCIMEYCHFEVPVVVQENTIVSNCQWLQSSEDKSLGIKSSTLVLPSETFLHTVSLLHEGTSHYVTIFFHISDNLKMSTAVSKLTSLPFLNRTVGSALKHWQLPESIVSSHVKSSEDKVSLWTLKMYPGAPTMTESLQMALDMVSCVRNECSLSCALSLDRHVFFSLADALALKDVSTMLNFRRKLFDQIVEGRPEISA